MSIIDCDGYLPDYDLDCGKFCPDESCFDLFCICLIDGTCISRSHSLVGDTPNLDYYGKNHTL